MHLTLKSYIAGIEQGTLKAHDVIDYYIQKAERENPSYNAFLRFHKDYIQKSIHEFESLPLHAAPIGIKDIILTKDYISSCASKMLEDFVSPYSATCFENLEKHG